MRTPKQKKSAPKTKRGGGGATDKLRKKAMKSKMMKKTLLAVGGDQTREDVRDLMNDSELSVCVAKVGLFYRSFLFTFLLRKELKAWTFAFAFEFIVFRLNFKLINVAKLIL